MEPDDGRELYEMSNQLLGSLVNMIPKPENWLLQSPFPPVSLSPLPHLQIPPSPVLPISCLFRLPTVFCLLPLSSVPYFELCAFSPSSPFRIPNSPFRFLPISSFYSTFYRYLF